ncbi:DNA-binding protein [Streptomyces sp. NPDC048636]|uniref:DNA-binding protein n=1 Tax=Streptomyces sp. NPDC048636 TaxID=3155762 RepID=UPI00341D8245
MSGGTQVSYEELLAAGAVLPPDTRRAPEGAVPLTARTYRHHGLDDRVVVRLVAGELGAAEDAAAAFLGLEQDAEPAVVGLGQRQSLGFPEWVLVHHPQDGHHALAVVPDLERAARQAKSRPKTAMEAFLELGERLAASVPHFLPSFYERAGRVFLAEENAKYAAQLFTRARKAEAEHGLAIDEEWLDTVFLEFALAGALPVKVLSAYGRELAARVPADEALRRFTRLCLRRTAGGMPPSAQMANDLRKLARAADRDADLVEQDYLSELLSLPATLRAAVGWWKGHRAALVSLAGRVPRVRGDLLDMTPDVHDEGMPALWLEVLEASGATAGLCDASLPEEERPRDGAAGWLERFLALWQRTRSWGGSPRMPELHRLVERAADCLRAELLASGGEVTVGGEIDLIDLLLSLDVPVAALEAPHALSLSDWATGKGQRDLLALAADARFREPFLRSADGLRKGERDLRAIRLLSASPGGRPMLAEWVRTVMRRCTAVGLPQLRRALSRLKWLPSEALVLAEKEVREAVGIDLAPLLARTLRAGLFDELGWPAWEDAAVSLDPGRGQHLVVSEAWPHLVVAGRTQARVIGAEGTLFAHDLRVPANSSWGEIGFHYVDGELLVYWVSDDGDGLRGYWHTRADHLQNLRGAAYSRGTTMRWGSSDPTVTLPLPGGGRTTGGAVLHAGDTTLPQERRLLCDGVSYWVWNADAEDRAAHGWYAYDPATNECGRMSMPAFLTDALRDAPAGSIVSGWLHPTPSTGAGPAVVPVDGLVGLRVVERPDGSLRAQDLAGRTVTLPPDSYLPCALVVFPGDDRPRAVVVNGSRYELVDTDGVTTTVADRGDTSDGFGTASPILPPLPYWAYLTPRDPEGSEALRHLDEDTAATLLRTAPHDDKQALPDAIRTLLPVTDPALVAGIAGAVRYAARQQAVLDAAVTRLTQALEGGGPELETEDEGPAGPPDTALLDAMNGVGPWWGGYLWGWDAEEEADNTFRALRMLTRAAGPTAPKGRTVRLHLDGHVLPSSHLGLETLVDRSTALAYRAAAATTSEEHREVLRTLLADFAALELEPTAESAHWRKVVLRLEADLLRRTPSGTWREGTGRGLLPLGGGAFVAVVERNDRNRYGWSFTGFFHDPTGRFETPEPYTLVSSAPVGEDGDAGRLGVFLSELAERGPAPWFPDAAEEFALLTGVTGTMARLIVAGLPRVDAGERTFLTTEARHLIGVKTAPAAVAKDELGGIDSGIRAAVVGALLPADPARLWTDGPDVTAAAAVWNARVGKRTPVPEELLGDALRALPHARWSVREALAALLDPAGEPRLSRDLEWAVNGDRVKPTDDAAVGFTAQTLIGSVELAAWLAHRLPVGDPIRASLAPALTAVRERLAHPGLVLDLDRYISLDQFRKAAGAPTEVGTGFERYGAVILATHDDQPAPGLRVALLDEAGRDPYLPALRLDDQRPFAAEAALRLARDARFAALLADSGDPLAGERGKDGTWWPQDPARSVPELVTEAAKKYGIGVDAAVLYLMLLAMPDPTDRMTARWTGWKPVRLKAARAELAATDLVVEATRTRAGRSLFLPGGWVEASASRVPLERWKLPLFADVASDGVDTPFGVVVPTEPVAELYRRAWQRVRDGEAPRFEELKVRRGRRR